jgi:hypothetical protein
MSKLSIKSKYLPYFVNSLKINYVTFEFFFFYYNWSNLLKRNLNVTFFKLINKITCITTLVLKKNSQELQKIKL